MEVFWCDVFHLLDLQIDLPCCDLLKIQEVVIMRNVVMEGVSEYVRRFHRRFLPWILVVALIVVLPALWR